MKKRRVLILIDSLATGGEEKSAVSLLNVLPSEKYDVTLMMLHRGGAFMDEVPGWVKIVDVPMTRDGANLFYCGLKTAVRVWLACGRIFQVIKTLWLRCKEIKLPRELRICLEVERGLDQKILDTYDVDVVMAYSSRLQLHMIAADHIRAKKKVLWLHCELENQGFDPQPYLRYWKKMDVWAAAASDKIVLDYVSAFPKYASRIVKMPLFLSREMCTRHAAESLGFVKHNEVVQLFSVGRLAYQKGFDIAVEVAARLKADGFRFVWSIAGDGPVRLSLEEKIKDFNVIDCLKLLGNQSNPYPYFATCDIYVQPSRYEGYCITLAEARAFCCPIVTTDFAGTYEQVVDGETALVVRCSIEEIYCALKKLIVNKELRVKLSRNLRKGYEYSGINDLEVLEGMLA